MVPVVSMRWGHADGGSNMHPSYWPQHPSRARWDSAPGTAAANAALAPLALMLAPVGLVVLGSVSSIIVMPLSCRKTAVNHWQTV